MKKKYLIIIMVLCLLVGCGKKEEIKNSSNSNNEVEQNEQKVPDKVNDDKNLLDPSDVLGEVEQAKMGVAQNVAYSLRSATQMFYMIELMENGDFETTTFTCNGKECSNGVEQLDIDREIPSSGEITINEDGTTIFSNIVINGYKCNIPDSGEITCTK